MRVAILLAAALCAAACTPERTRPAVSLVAPPEPIEPWRAALRPEDVGRIERLPATWQAARASARDRRSARALAAAGPLLVADAALDHPALPPGSYTCRLTTLGREPGKRAAVASFGEFFCYVRGEPDGQLTLTKQTGSDLPGGWLHAAGERRFVFVGARQKQPGDTSLGYGTDAERDLAGVVERIAPFRWRLVLPSRRSDAALEVYELTPVPADRQAPAPADQQPAPV